jgi:uncharacterized protein (DUF58 family)
MWRISYRMFRAVSAVIHWGNRRFTAAGLLVLSGLVVSGSLGVDTTLSVAYQAFGLLLALMAASALCVPLLRVPVSVERELPRVATAGEPFTYRVRVANLGSRALDGLSLFEDFADPRPSFEAFRAAVRFPTYRAWKHAIEMRRTAHLPRQRLAPLPPRGRAQIDVQARALRRGIAHSTGVTAARADPLGLVNALARAPRGASLVVLPRRYALPPLALPGSRRYQPGGVTLATSVGDAEEFVGLREYRPGDPLQRVHWKSFARAGWPIVKEFQTEYFERHGLVLDSFATARDERAFEEAVSIAASFVHTIDTRECLLDLMFIGAEVHRYTAGRGQMRAGGLLEVLAGVQPCRDRTFSVLADAVLARRHIITSCICILLGWDDARSRFVRQLRAHGIDTLAIAVSPDPVAAPPPGLLIVQPGRVQEGLARL